MLEGAQEEGECGEGSSPASLERAQNMGQSSSCPTLPPYGMRTRGGVVSRSR